MYTRQWMVTHKWMLDYTHQSEWIERRGIMVWIAEVFTTLGSGLYLVALYFDIRYGADNLFGFYGMVLAWIIIMALKVPIHLMYFGKPFRFWRTLPPFTKGWKTSWFTRGIIFTVLFGGFAFVQLALAFISRDLGWINLGWLPVKSGLEYAFMGLSAATALVVGVYGGFIMNYCKSVPFWKSNLLPVVFLIGGIADGFGLMVAVALAGGDAKILPVAEIGTRWALIASALILITYLISAIRRAPAAKISVMELVGKGTTAIAFWLGVVAFGIVVPLTVSVYSMFSAAHVTPIILIIAVICHTLGAFAIKYCLLRVGIHRPILSLKANF